MGSMTRLEDKPNSKCRKWRLFASKGSGADRVQKSRRFKGSWTEAKRALADFEREFAGLPTSSDSAMTFRELGDMWLESRKGMVAETTRQKDSRSLTTLCWIIGSERICDVTPPMMSEVYGRMMIGESPTGKMLSGNYVNQVGQCARMAFQYAVDRGFLSENPCDGADLPKMRLKERVPPTAAQVSSLLSQLDPAEHHQMCAYLCASMGLRKGEALRDLPIPEHVHDALRRRRAALERDLARLAEAGVIAPPDTATWPTIAICAREDGLVVSSEGMSAWWKVHSADYGMGKFTMHDLRHAYLTAAAVNGVPPRVMQALAGHSSPITTMRIYAHANMDAKATAAGILASVLHPNASQ